MTYRNPTPPDGDVVIPKTFRERMRDAALGGASATRWVAGLAVLFSGMTAGTALGRYLAERPPAAPEPCIESAVILTSSDTRHSCPAGAHAEITPRGEEKIAVRCICGAREGGSP